MIEIKSVKAAGKYFFKLMLGDDTTMKLHQDTVFKYGLLNAKTLDKPTFTAMKKDDEINTLTQKALDELAKKQLARRGLYRALKPYGEPASINTVLDQLEQNGYLDDEKALNRTVDDAIEFGSDGPVKLKHQLIKDGFETAAVLEALSRFDETLQQEKIRVLISRALRLGANITRQKLKERLMRNLYNKGYEPDVFMPVIEQELQATDLDETALLEKRLTALKGKYDLKDHKDKQKLIQKLMREGFTYESIKSKL